MLKLPYSLREEHSVRTASIFYLLRIAVVTTSLGLSACGPSLLQPPPPRPHIHHSEAPPREKQGPLPMQGPMQEIHIYRPDDYILQLSRADLLLRLNPASGSATDDISAIRNYTRQPQPDKLLQPAVVIEYSMNNDRSDRRRIAIPFTMPHDNQDFPGLDDIMRQLDTVPYTLYDMKLAVITIAPQPPLDSDTASESGRIYARLQQLIGGAMPLPPMVQARMELQLTRFFMLHGYKQAAYLAIDNAKHSIAMVDGRGDVQATQDLSRQIEKQENLLYKTMPFTL